MPLYKPRAGNKGEMMTPAWNFDIDPAKTDLFPLMQENVKAKKRRHLRNIMPMANDKEIDRFL